MAGQAAKKLKRAAEVTGPKYSILAGFFWTWFILLNYFLQKNIPWLSGIFFGLVSFSAQKMINEALRLGVAFDSWQDLLLVTAAAEFFGGLHPWGVSIWLLVPGYLAVTYGAQALDYLKSTQGITSSK